VIGGGAFQLCSSLTSVTIPGKVVSIGAQAFFYCTSLASVTIPESVMTLGAMAFYQCTALTSISIPGSISSIERETFSHCDNLVSVTLGNGVRGIGDNAFMSCLRLTSVTMPPSLVFIGPFAFANCEKLTTLTIPNGVTSLGDYAFWLCSKLTAMKIPGSVTSIGNDTFNACTSLSSLQFEGSTAPTRIGTNWVLHTQAGLKGHAYGASNFPAPGGFFYGLSMGSPLLATPGPARDVSALAGIGKVALTWIQPASDGGAPITGYGIFRSTSSGFQLLSNVSASTLSFVDTSSAAGNVYTYYVVAANAVGDGAGSVHASAVPTSAATDYTMLLIGLAVAIIAANVVVSVVLRKR